MFVTIITDCKSENDFGRQATRFASLFNCNVTTVGVSSSLKLNNASIEAAGNLVDVLDASEGKKGIVAVNVAPRGGTTKKWENGTPFCYFWYKETLVLSTFDGLALSLVKKLKLVEKVYLTDIPEVTAKLVTENVISKELADHIVKTQFRSYEYLPRLAKWITDGIEIPNSEVSINEIPDAPNCVWYVDTFGNCKTTLLKEELNIKNSTVSTTAGIFNFYERLKEIPHNETGIYIGSSGIGENRFIEVAVQRKHGNKELGLNIGDLIEGK